MSALSGEDGAHGHYQKLRCDIFNLKKHFLEILVVDDLHGSKRIKGDQAFIPRYDDIRFSLNCDFKQIIIIRIAANLYTRSRIDNCRFSMKKSSHDLHGMPEFS